ncbi:hypothetical protein RHCRD62_40550 [Rhodococcus sp. RD6.2]|nr:hypothetical protein RHCRD62_40550 [Rhodococcus sp. RD6.2]
MYPGLRGHARDRRPDEAGEPGLRPDRGRLPAEHGGELHDPTRQHHGCAFGEPGRVCRPEHAAALGLQAEGRSGGVEPESDRHPARGIDGHHPRSEVTSGCVATARWAEVTFK